MTRYFLNLFGSYFFRTENINPKKRGKNIATFMFAELVRKNSTFNSRDKYWVILQTYKYIKNFRPKTLAVD